MTFPATLTADQ